MKAFVVTAFMAMMGFSTAGGLLAPSAISSSESPQQDERATPHKPPMPGGMISNSISPPPVVIQGPPMRPPPIVAIPRVPGGPGDLMVPHGERELRTVRSFARIEDCDTALASYRRQRSDAFCVSTVPPPPEPDHAELLELDSANQLVGLQSFPSMAACEQERSRLPAVAGRTRMCTKIKWH